MSIFLKIIIIYIRTVLKIATAKMDMREIKKKDKIKGKIFSYPFPQMIDEISNALRLSDTEKINNQNLENYFPLHGQYCYFTNFRDKKLFNSKGIKEVLGYDENEFNYDLIFHYFHPDDLPIVHQILIALFKTAFTKGFDPDCPFNITHRVKKKDGTYIKVLRQSTVYEMSNDGRLVSNFSLVSDISYLDNSPKVSWYIKEDNDQRKSLANQIRKQLKSIFTPREHDVINGLLKGQNSKQIAEEIGISHHTVDTIRRNMLSKTGCRNTVALINLSQQSVLRK